MKFPNFWGEGLFPKRYWGGRLQLRRNSLVHEIELHISRVRITLTRWRKR